MSDNKKDIKVTAIFTYYGEGQKQIFDSIENGDFVYEFHLDPKMKESMIMEEIMLKDVKVKVDNYNNETGILKTSFLPSIPIWVFDKFDGWFIPVFEKVKV